VAGVRVGVLTTKKRSIRFIRQLRNWSSAGMRQSWRMRKKVFPHDKSKLQFCTKGFKGVGGEERKVKTQKGARFKEQIGGGEKHKKRR